MKNFKKIMALIVAMVMIVGTMSTVAFAAPGDLTPDSTIKIEGLASGDTVHLYQILQFDENDGWQLVHEESQASPYAALVTTGNDNFSQKVKDLVNNVPNTTLDKADLEKITNVIKAVEADAVVDQKINSSTFTYTTTSAPGMYLALVTPGEAGVVYNPIVVSADFSAGNTTSEINASTAIMGTHSVAKKEKIEVTKTSDEKDTAQNLTTDGNSDGSNNAHDVGDIVKFTITTKIPAYSDSYTNPKFKVTDTLSNGLKIVVDDAHQPKITCSVAVDTASDDYVAIANDGISFCIPFKSDEIADLETYADVTIEYYAEITGAAATNVTEEENTVKVEFSNNPQDDDDYGIIKDKTKHYTFTIDGNLLGEESWKNSELVKVGVDQQGNPIESVITESNGSRQAALAGALFKLYNTPEGAEAEDEEDLYKNDVFKGEVTSDALGLMTIKGLDVGDYYLKEITAPKGYIRSTKVWHINVSATITDKDTTEYIGGREVTYKVPTLESYSITINDDTTSTFTATISGSQVLTSTSKGDISTSIANTKGVELPSTGGMGTTIFYIIGAVLVIGAGILLVTRRRMSAN